MWMLLFCLTAIFVSFIYIYFPMTKTNAFVLELKISGCTWNVNCMMIWNREENEQMFCNFLLVHYDMVVFDGFGLRMNYFFDKVCFIQNTPSHTHTLQINMSWIERAG